MKTKLIFAGGVLSILLGLFHGMFWTAFDWAAELPKLSVINSRVMQMLDLAVICLLVCLGVILIACRQEVARTRTGSGLLWMLVLFYVIRIAGEFYFPGGDLWTAAILLLYLLIYLIPALMRRHSVSSTTTL